MTLAHPRLNVQPSPRMRLAACVLVLAVALIAPTGAAPSSMAPVTKPTSSFNGQSACVQYGDCTSPGHKTYKTESNYSPVKPPPSHSIENPKNKSGSMSYKSKVAASGARAQYNPKSNHGSSTPVPPPTTPVFATTTRQGSRTVTKTLVHSPSSGASHANVRSASTSMLATTVVVTLATALLGCLAFV